MGANLHRRERLVRPVTFKLVTATDVTNSTTGMRGRRQLACAVTAAASVLRVGLAVEARMGEQNPSGRTAESGMIIRTDQSVPLFICVRTNRGQAPARPDGRRPQRVGGSAGAITPQEPRPADRQPGRADAAYASAIASRRLAEINYNYTHRSPITAASAPARRPQQPHQGRRDMSPSSP